MATETQGTPVVLQVEPGGRLALTETLLSSADLHEGDRVLVLPLEPGLIYLRKVDVPEPLSRKELSALIRTAFDRSGYTTREQVLALVREAKRERAQDQYNPTPRGSQNAAVPGLHSEL